MNKNETFFTDGYDLLASAQVVDSMTDEIVAVYGNNSDHYLVALTQSDRGIPVHRRLTATLLESVMYGEDFAGPYKTALGHMVTAATGNGRL